MGTWMCHWMLFSCIFASHTTHSFFVTQSPELTSVSVGDSVELKCTAEQTVHYCYNSATWQKSNLRTGELKPVKTSYDNSVLKSDGKTCVLTLENVTPEDSGFYYCIHQSYSMAMVGNGSRVIVTGSSKPKLSILYSPQEDESPSVALQCLVSGVVPSQVQVFWMIGEKKRVGWTESAWSNNNDSATEFTRAHLSVPAEEWTEAQEIQCFVQFNGEDFSKTLKQNGLEPIYSWVLYAGCMAALLTILVTILMSVGLYRDLLVTKKTRGLTRKDAHRKISYGKQNTMREDSSSVAGFSGDVISHGQDVSPSKE